MMKNKIIDFKTQQEANKNFYKILANVDCDNDLELVKNERSDASYQYLVRRLDNKNIIGKIGWNNKFVSNNENNFLPPNSKIKEIITDEFKNMYGTNYDEMSLESAKQGGLIIINWLLNNR